MKKSIGLIAGGGQFPLLFIKEAQKQDHRIVVIAHLGETDPNITTLVDNVHWIKLGQLGKIIKIFQKEHITQTAFAGTITKTRIFHDIFPDLKGLTLWNKIDFHQDDAILRAVAKSLEVEGIMVVPSTIFLKKLFFPAGLLTRKSPSPQQLLDLQFGWKIAAEIGKLDIGQTVVIKDRAVLAVEAIEGTDKAIERGGQLAGKGCVVIKRKKPNQDFRFDLPAIGVTTIKTLQGVKGALLGVESGESLLFDLNEFVEAADKSGIIVIGLTNSVTGEATF